MRVFVSEYVCSGAWSEGLPPASLFREGRSMLAAILADIARISGCSLVTTWDMRLDGFSPPGVEILRTSGPLEERRCFERLAAESDATFVIAPEFGGILLDRRRTVDRVGGRFVGPDAEAIALCADKLMLARHLERHAVATIPTVTLAQAARAQAFEFPLVMKPRDGAGSQNTFLADNPEALAEARNAFAGCCESGEPICQPYVAGCPLSVSAVLAPDRERIDVFPVGEQCLSGDGRFANLGGRVPARISHDARERITELARGACRSIPGLCGYVGIDVILPASAEPCVVEINPRLTTSYLGYRELADENMGERVLFPERAVQPVRWREREVRFTPDGLIDNQPAAYPRYSATS